MNWQTLLAERRVKTHRTSREEIRDLRGLIRRDLADSRIKDLSADRRFATAYKAALQTAKLCIACEGYRVADAAHHQTSFEALPLVFGPPAEDLAAYLETCRRKRNQVDYDLAGSISNTEADEIARAAEELLALAETWVRLNHPELIRQIRPRRRRK